MSYRSAAHEAIAKGHHRFGYIPDSDDKRRRQKDARLRFAGSVPIPKQASLMSFEGPCLDQGPFGSCTGHGTAQAVFASCGAAGAPLPFFPSPGLIYRTVRVLERPDSSTPLTDSGAMPSDLLPVLRQWGVSPMLAPTIDGRNSDLDDTNCNVEPSLLELERTGMKLVTGEYRVDETAPDFDTQIRASLAGVGGKPAAGGIGIFVDSSFENWDPASGPITNINLNDPNGGGHWLELSYSYTTPGGIIVLGGINSWSKLWPSGTSVPGSPYWTPGHYEITAPCLKTTLSDCLLFPVTVLS